MGTPPRGRKGQTLALGVTQVPKRKGEIQSLHSGEYLTNSTVGGNNSALLRPAGPRVTRAEDAWRRGENVIWTSAPLMPVYWANGTLPNPLGELGRPRLRRCTVGCRGLLPASQGIVLYGGLDPWRILPARRAHPAPPMVPRAGVEIDQRRNVFDDAGQWSRRVDARCTLDERAGRCPMPIARCPDSPGLAKVPGTVWNIA